MVSRRNFQWQKQRFQLCASGHCAIMWLKMILHHTLSRFFVAVWSRILLRERTWNSWWWVLRSFLPFWDPFHLCATSLVLPPGTPLHQDVWSGAGGLRRVVVQHNWAQSAGDPDSWDHNVRPFAPEALSARTWVLIRAYFQFWGNIFPFTRRQLPAEPRGGDTSSRRKSRLANQRPLHNRK